jgi:hypothetical protein
MYLLILYALMNKIVFAFLLAVQICNVLFHGVRRVVDILIISRDSFHQVCYLSVFATCGYAFFYKDTGSVSPQKTVKALSLSYF